MRRALAPLFGVGMAVVLLGAPASSGAATELEGLREDLRRTQEEFQKLLELQQQTQRRLEELQKKMDAVERATAQPPPATAPAAAAEPAAGTPAPATASAQPAPPAEITPVPTAPSPQLRGPTIAGRALLFDLGVLGSMIGSISSARNPLAGQTPTFIARENRIFPQEVEIAAQGAVDPYIRADVFFDFGEDGEIANGSVTRNLDASIEEAYATSLSLPWGLQVRGGRMRPAFGLLGQLHPHDLPQIDAPAVLTNFFTEERLKENGVEWSWVAPLDTFLEFRLGVFDGDNPVSFGAGNIRDPLVTGRAKTFFELSDDQGLQLGLSGATGPNEWPDTPNQNGDGRTLLGGADFKYKWKPLGEPYKQFILAGEFLFGHFRREPLPGANPGCPFAPGSCLTNRFGFYVFGDYQLGRAWFAGTRFDWSQFPPNPNPSLTLVPSAELRQGAREYAIAPYLTFKPSEFFQLRTEYKHTIRNYTKNADEGFLQAIFILGTHPPHPW